MDCKKQVPCQPLNSMGYECFLTTPVKDPDADLEKARGFCDAGLKARMECQIRTGNLLEIEATDARADAPQRGRRAHGK